MCLSRAAGRHGRLQALCQEPADLRSEIISSHGCLWQEVQLSNEAYVVHDPFVSAPASVLVLATVLRKAAAVEDKQEAQTCVIIMATCFYFSKLAVS